MCVGVGECSCVLVEMEVFGHASCVLVIGKLYRKRPEENVLQRCAPCECPAVMPNPTAP